MQNLGFTRSANRHDHLLQTPDTFVRAPLPGMRNATAIVHVGPARGAGFTQYTIELEANGSFQSGPAQTFIYVLEGMLTLTTGHERGQLSANHFAYLPPASDSEITCSEPARAVLLEKAFHRSGEFLPARFSGDENALPLTPLQGDDSIAVRTLIPDNPEFDFAVNTMTYQPGASLPMVEIHIMEHGLLMLEGEGIYRLGDHWYPVKAGDFIWMAPCCPQWFGALGKTPSRYLIYKDWNRHPLQSK